MPNDTASQSWGKAGAADRDASPGLVVVFSGVTPQLAPIALDKTPIVLGRGALGPHAIEDSCMSRKHAEVTWSRDRIHVRDLGSHNGTFVDGDRIQGEHTLAPGARLRVGDTLLVPVADVRTLRGAGVERTGGVVIGPTLRRAWDAIARVAEQGKFVHIQGETGSGKELAARHYHRMSGRGDGPLMAVNCASVPPLLAERLLFGARRGAYSGADTDAEGYLQGADGGTLFLDEIGELSLDVQAKLLRTIESSEVLPLGATRPRRVDVRLCSATHADLRESVARGRFREDLYYRVGRPQVILPPLRERPEELPWLLQSLLADDPRQLSLHASLVEAVLLRPWPGNVRELATEIANAAGVAHAAGVKQVRALHLDAAAGQPLAAAASEKRAPMQHTPETLLAEIAKAGGSVTAAARALGLHRNQLRRLITQHKLELPAARKR